MPLEHTGPCGATDDVYTCTKQTIDGDHNGQHHDQDQDVLWRNSEDWC